MMTPEKYKQIKSWFEERPIAYAMLKATQKGLTLLVYIAYGLLILWTWFFMPEKILKVILVPAFTFVSGSAIRKGINAPRPYEVMQMAPLIKKETKGKSFPSRHVFCASVIAVAFFYTLPPVGTLMTVIALVIAGSRVLAGVHWPKDVIAGLLYGGIVGLIGFFVI